MSSYPPVEDSKAFDDHHPQNSTHIGDHERGLMHSNSHAFDGEKNLGLDSHGHVITDAEAPRALHRDLQGRHMQMIAVGGAIGAGLFVGSGSALAQGGPASVFLGFTIVGILLVFVMQAMAELAVMYPVNGAFFTYSVRFIDPAWGFAVGWEYALDWLTVLPFEVVTATITLQFWKATRDINVGAWITIFLFILIVIQFFGVRGYGEVEFVLAVIKILAVIGFIILAIIIDCGGVGHQGYIGAKYWYGPKSNPGATAFRGGFNGFCGVFSTASFAYGGTELTGLAAAEAANPLKSVPKACKQVIWRIAIFYILSLLLVGFIVPSDSPYLLNSGSNNPKYSPFVRSIVQAGIPVLPSIFNVVILLSVISVANSCTFGSTRTMQALAACGMGPKWLSYVDKKGRPVWCVLIQILFGFLAYVGEAPGASEQLFDWLLALSGVADFFIWGSVCWAHIRFRSAWKYNGRTLDEIPYHAQYGVWGSYCGMFLSFVCLLASFYNAIIAGNGSGMGASYSAELFFRNWLSGPLLVLFYLGWKIYSGNWFPLLVPISEIDITSGMRLDLDELRQAALENKQAKTWANLPMRAARNLF